jgi:hypothetical protein
MARRYVRFGLTGPGDDADRSGVKQTQIVRRHRRHGGNGEPPADLPVVAVSDTTAAARVLAAIDAALAS